MFQPVTIVDTNGSWARILACVKQAKIQYRTSVAYIRFELDRVRVLSGLNEVKEFLTIMSEDFVTFDVTTQFTLCIPDLPSHKKKLGDVYLDDMSRKKTKVVVTCDKMYSETAFAIPRENVQMILKHGNFIARFDKLFTYDRGILLHPDYEGPKTVPSARSCIVKKHLLQYEYFEAMEMVKSQWQKKFVELESTKEEEKKKTEEELNIEEALLLDSLEI